MAEDALPRGEEGVSPFALGRNRRVGFVVIVTEIPEMAECIPNCQTNPLPLSSIG